ncbi:MAG TPA: M1 family metallopeptidase [Thermoleophilaceae bacterium]|nr:M1 family metallopeptidase [Thermoleophilaceae bacterium]
MKTRAAVALLTSMLAIGVASAPAQADSFRPGARSVGDAILPQLGNGGYDARAYDIDLDYNPVANRFRSAVSTMTAKATQNLSEFSLDFQDLRVREVRVDGKQARFSQVDATPDLSSNPDHSQPMKLVVKPKKGIRRGDRFDVQVDYSGSQPQVFTDPDDAIEGWIPACYTPAGGTQVCDSFFVVGEPIGSQAWFPSNNHPSDKAKATTEITVPEGDTAFGVGELVKRKVDRRDGTVTWKWAEDDPTATYLLTASNGKFDYTESSVREAITGRRLPIYTAIDRSATPTQKANLATNLGRTGEMMNFLAERYGPYPFDSNGALVDRAPSVGYALEVQGKSHYATLNTDQSTIAHEITHQWFGNSVTLEHWADIWFNEGWAQWSEWLWNATNPPAGQPPEPSTAEQFDANYAAASDEDWDVAPAVLDNDPANLFSFFPTYVRGAMTVEGYRQIVGERRFFAVAKAIQREFAYDNVSTREFIDFAVSRSGLSGAKRALLRQYFQQWLYGTDKPTILPAAFD